MFKKIIYTIIIVAILFGITNIENLVTDGGEKLLTTFHDIQFEMIEADIHMWGEYSRSYMSEDEMKELAMKIADSLEINDDIVLEYVEEDFEKSCTIQKESKEAKTFIKVIEMIEEVENNGLKVENYLVVNITLLDKFDSVLYYREKMKDLFTEQGISITDNLTLTSRQKGMMEEAESREVMETILRNLNGKIRDQYMTKNIYSIYAYSNYIPEHIVTKGEKINVDLAITYNEEEDMTYLYAAIPVIPIDY